MAKKKADAAQDENPAGLTDEELAAQAEMIDAGDEIDADAEIEDGDEDAKADADEADAEAKADADRVAVAAAAVAEAKDKDQSDKAAKKAEPPTVPLPALDSERHKRKEGEAEIAALKAQILLLAPKPADAAPKDEEIPDPVLDFEGFKAWHARDAARRAQPVQQMQQQMRQAQEFTALKGFAQTSEAKFSADTPDYGDALAHAREMKAKEFRAYGYTDEQIPALVDQVEGSIALLARQQGVNPASIIYDYAKMTGYKGAKAAEESAGEKIARLDKIKAKTQSTAGATGSARNDEITPERLDEMDDEELAKVPESAIRAAMGG